MSIGATADICIFDPKAHWILSADKFVSRGRNSPFLGWEFTGRVTHTLVGGEVVFELAARNLRHKTTRAPRGALVVFTAGQ